MIRTGQNEGEYWSAVALQEAADKAEEIIRKHDEGASMDEGFDAGEFSGPAHEQMQDAEIKQLAEQSGLTFDEVMGEVERRQHEASEQQ